jgi:hypothetical protein
MPKSFSILTVSKRQGWFERQVAQVANQKCPHCEQLMRPDKWVIVPEAPMDIYITPVPIEMHPAPPAKHISNLNASLNEGLRHISSQYVIFYQDFIDLPPDCFDKLLQLVDENTFVTTCTINADGTQDGRYAKVDAAYECPPNFWEANVAIAPMKLVRELGGFDESYDQGWSWDNVNLAERAKILGAKFIIDETNQPKLLFHEKETKIAPNGDRHADTMKKIKEGLLPLRLNNLY